MFVFQMAATGKIIDLRKLLVERFPHAPGTAATHLVTGSFFLDESTSGGLPRGAITELICPRTSAGSASLIHTLVHAAHRDNHFLALIDGRDSFDLCGLDNASLRHLLWVRCSKASEVRSEEHTSELQSLTNLVCRLLLEKKKKKKTKTTLYNIHKT